MDIAAIILGLISLVLIPIAGPVISLFCIALGLLLGIASFIRKRKSGDRIRKPIVGIVITTFALVIALSVVNDAEVAEVRQDKTDFDQVTVSMKAPGKPQWNIEPSARRYHDIRVFLSDYPQDKFGTYLLPVSAFEEMESRFDMILPPEEIERGRRWREQFEVHWPNIDAFQASTAAISADRIIDREESRHTCFAHEQWTTQMTEARDYIREYREVEPQVVEQNPGLRNLEREAERALGLLAKVECQ